MNPAEQSPPRRAKTQKQLDSYERFKRRCYETGVRTRAARKYIEEDYVPPRDLTRTDKNEYDVPPPVEKVRSDSALLARS